MAKLTLVRTGVKANTNLAHRASTTEGEAARRLLEDQGYIIKRVSNGQAELRCPFHEGPGMIEGRKSTSFYMNAENSKYFCFSGDTRILTPLGARALRDVVGEVRLMTASAVTGKNKTQKRRGEWVDAEVRSFGVQSLRSVTLTRNGFKKVVRATPEHRWFALDQSKVGSKEVTTDQLRVGDRLLAAFAREMRPDTIVSSIGVAHGITYGDGTRRQGGSSVDLYGDKNQKLLRFFPEPHTRSIVSAGGVDGTTVFALPAYFKERPALTEATNYLLGWLSGYFAADGTVSQGGTVSLQSANRDDLMFARDVCTRVGISTYSVSADGYERTGINGHRSPMYHLTIMGSTLQPSFFQVSEHRDRFELTQGRAEHYGWTVESIVDNGEAEEVFCAVVPGTEAFVLEDNILTGNCQSASCQERGNLQTLERFFGIDVGDADDYASTFKSRETQLQQFERALVPALRKPFYEHGLTDATIERFRLGFEPTHTETREDGTTIQIADRYVIPYLEGRRPKMFRYYQPYGDPKYKYMWELGSEAALYNAQDALGDKDGIVFLCYTPDTEILTAEGWVSFPDLKDGQHVAQYDPANAEVSFVKPDARQVLDYSGEMVSISGDHASLMVTPDHRVLARSQNGNWRTRSAKELVGRKNLQFPVAGYLSSGPSVKGEPQVARLLMAWVADGCRVKEGNQVYWNLKKQRKIDRLVALLDELHISYSTKSPPSHEGWTEIWIQRDALESRGIDTRQKLIRSNALGYGLDARRALLEEARFWDGDGDGDSSRFFTGEKANADALSEIAALSGYGCVVREDAREGRNPSWVVNLTARQVRQLSNGVQLAGHYQGKVYCVSVPSTYIVVRRNGKTMVSGNCEGEQKAMLLTQMGYAAVAVPGAGQWRDEFQAAFTHAKKIIVLFDNDNPTHHIYDKPAEDRFCGKCRNKGLPRCIGHNPGQEAAQQRVEQLGWRATNVVLPLPSPDERKVDINDYFVRDGASGADFAQLALGKSATPFKIRTLGEIMLEPPEEANFLIEQGILPVGGRLLIAGKPKVGKSIFADNLALSLAAGIPFLKRFSIDHPTRVLLLDRELSKRSLFDRMGALVKDRPGYRASFDNLMIDHDHLLRLDQKESYDLLMRLVEDNGAEVVIMDTAYKFLGGDVESSAALMKAFEVLDRVIHATGVAMVMTHHLKKGQGGKGKENTDIADPDGVAGSFLWTGWPNATVLLNYMNRSVENPYNSVCTFTAFRDAAAPEPLALYRDKTTISYTAIQDYSYEDQDSGSTQRSYSKPTTETVQQLLLELTPVTEEDFLLAACHHFGAKITTIRPYFLDAMTSGHFERSKGRPPVIKFVGEQEEESWEQEHGLPDRPNPALQMEPMNFDAASLA